jgi:hypothetical protein
MLQLPPRYFGRGFLNSINACQTGPKHLSDSAPKDQRISGICRRRSWASPWSPELHSAVRTVDFDVELDVDARRPREEVKRHYGRFYHEKGLGKAAQGSGFAQRFCWTRLSGTRLVGLLTPSCGPRARWILS